MSNLITLLTDYGTKDAFVASMKGMILKLAPQAQIVDITHEVAPQDVWEAAFTLKETYNQFPKGTIHLAVVDPGVGSGRKPILCVTEGYYFVGPDNGIFSFIYRDAERLRVHHISASHYFVQNPGPTFHGRDIFAPVAAWLVKGIPAANFGDEITDFVKLNVPVPKRTNNVIDGHVIHADRFGNLITNITYRDLQPLTPEGVQLGPVTVAVAGKQIAGLRKFYAEAQQGVPGAIINSNGHLEIFLFRQNARTALAIKRGESVRVTVLQSA
ncbi:MAG: SAM-dependent chlorinase/fluorinase [Nitrospiraceae bacterium]|nr:SAM-dependent chlorinase/fluorinase [Nitrospiraceae bacterium]